MRTPSKRLIGAAIALTGAAALSPVSSVFAFPAESESAAAPASSDYTYPLQNSCPAGIGARMRYRFLGDAPAIPKYRIMPQRGTGGTMLQIYAPPRACIPLDLPLDFGPHAGSRTSKGVHATRI